VTPMREFADQRALQNYVKLHDLVYLWEGTRPFAMRVAQLSPEQCEVVDVRTKRGVTRALLFRKAILRAEWCFGITTPAFKTLSDFSIQRSY
jgi:hypothetical protein